MKFKRWIGSVGNIFKYTLDLSRRSPTTLLLYFLTLAYRNNYLGLAVLPTYLIKEKWSVFVSAAILIIGLITRKLSQTMETRFEEEVRSQFLPNLINRLGYLGLEELEKTRVQNLIFNVRENFELIKRVMDFPFIFFPAFIGMVAFLSIAYATLPLAGNILVVYALITVVGSYLLSQRLILIERSLAPFRQLVSSMPARLLQPNHLVDVTMQGDVDWFARKMDETSVAIYSGQRRIRRLLFFRSVISWGAFVGLWSLIIMFSLDSITESLGTTEFTFQIEDVAQDSIIFISIYIAMLSQQVADALAHFSTGRSVVDQFLRLARTRQSEADSNVKLRAPDRIIVDHVDLSLSGKKILSDISFSVEKGQKVAVVGGNGSGKSTLIKLLAHQYQPVSGSLNYGRSDLELVYMSQDPVLFPSLTIRENLLLGLQVEDDALEQALACLWEGAELDSYCGSHFSGFNPSGGQRQRIAWARLFLQIHVRKPDLIILDEPTSALDVATERELMKRILEVDSTVIYVTHKDLLASMADRVLVLEKGHMNYFGDPSDAVFVEQNKQ